MDIFWVIGWKGTKGYLRTLKKRKSIICLIELVFWHLYYRILAFFSLKLIEVILLYCLLDMLNFLLRYAFLFANHHPFFLYLIIFVCKETNIFL